MIWRTSVIGLICFVLMGSASAATATFNGTNSNLYNDTTLGNWSGGGGVNGGPGATDDVVIAHDCLLSVTGAFIGGTFTVQAGKTFTVQDVTLTVNSATAINGTISFTGTASLKLFIGGVTIANGATWQNTANADAEFRAGLSIGNTATFSAGTGNLYSFTTANQTLNLNGVSRTISSIDVGSGVTLTGSSGRLIVPGGLSGSGAFRNVGTLEFAGNASFLISTFDATTNPGNTVEYTGLGGSVRNYVYHHLTIKDSPKSWLGAETINGDLTIASSGSTNIVATTNNLVTVGGTASIASGCSLQLSNTMALTVNGTTTVGGTLTISSSGAQTLKGAVTVTGAFNNSGNANVELRAGLDISAATSFTSGAGTYSFTTGAVQTLATGNQARVFTTIDVGTGVNLTATQTTTVGEVTVGTLSGAGTYTNQALLGFTGSTIGVTTFVSNAGSVRYSGASPTMRNTAYVNLFVEGSGTTAWGGITTITGLLRINTNSTTLDADVSVAGNVDVFSGALNLGTHILDSNGSFTQTGGTFNGGSGQLYVAGNFTHSGGTFTAGTGTVFLDGNSQTITGDTTFNNLSKVTSSAQTITFTAGSTQTITGTLTLTGAAGQLITLQSSAAGTDWNINPSGTRSVSFVSVSDSNNQNATAILPSNSTDGGGNTNWFPPSTKTWIGGAGDWDTNANWSPTGRPGATDSVSVPSGTPALSGQSRSIASLTISGGASVDTNSQVLTVTGALSNGGTVTSTSGSLKLAGSASQSISGGGSIDVLVLNNTAGFTLSGNQTVNTTFTMTAGAVSTGVNTLFVKASSVSVLWQITSTTGSLTLNGSAAQTLLAPNTIDNLTIANATTLADTMRVKNTLTVNSGTTLSTGSFTLLVDKILNVAGTVSSSTGSLLMDSNVPRTIGGGGMVGVLELTNAAGTTMTDDLTITDTLFVYGSLSTGANTLFFTGSFATIQGAVSSTTGSINLNGAAPQMLFSSAATTDRLTISNGSGVTLASGSIVHVGKQLTITSGSVLAVDDYSLLAFGDISNAGAITCAGGSVVLAGSVSGHNLTGTGSYGRLDLNDSNGAAMGASFTITDLILSDGTLNVGANTLTVDGGTVAPAATASLTGAGGTLALSGTGTLGGAGTVNISTINITGAAQTTTLAGNVTAASGVSVAASHTLAGSGTITGNVTCNGPVSPGTASLATIGSANFTASATATLDFDFGTPTSCDKIAATGSVNLTGSTLNVANFGGNLASGTYTFATCTGTPTLPTLGTTPAGFNFSLSASSGKADLIVNRIPSISLPSANPTFIENGSAAAIDSGATLGDDSPNYNTGTLTVTIASPLAGDQLSILAAGGISTAGSNVLSGATTIGTFSGTTTLTINLNSNATPTNVQALLRAIAYSSSSDNPDNFGANTTRSISVTLNDGAGATSNTPSKTVNVSAVNDAPSVSVTGAGNTYTEGSASGVLVLASATVSDVDDTDLTGGTVTVGYSGFSQASDTLTVVDAGNITVAGNIVSDLATPIGTTSGGTSGGNLVITLTGAVTFAQVQDLLAAISYSAGAAEKDPSNGGANPSRTIQFSVNDGTTPGNTTASVAISAINDGPTATVPGGTLTPQEDTNFTVSGVSVADPDSGTTNISVTFSATSGTLTVNTAVPGGVVAGDVAGNGTSSVVVTAARGAINTTLGAAGGLIYLGNADFNGADTLVVSVNDNGNTGSGGALSDSQNQALSVSAVNDRPTFSTLGNQSSNEDAGLQTVPGFAFGFSAGPGEGSQALLQYNVSNNNNGLFATQPAVDNAGVLTYQAAANAFGSATVTISATDDGPTGGANQNTSLAQTFTITINPVADTPSVTAATTAEDTLSSGGLVITRNGADGVEVTHFKITNITNGTLFLADGTTPVPDGTFLTVAQGGAGLRFMPNLNFPTITPGMHPASGLGTFQVQASLNNTDAGLGTAPATAQVTVNEVNDPPGVAATALAIFDQNFAADQIPNVALPNQPITFSIGATDVDDVLQYTWDFGDGTALGSGSPIVHAFAAAGTYNITVSVTDGRIGAPIVRNVSVNVNTPPRILSGPMVQFNPIPFNEIQSFLVSVAGANGADEDGDTLTYVWDFGDISNPVVTTAGSTQHTYIIAGVPQELFTSGGTAEITATVTITDDGRGANSGRVTKSVTFLVVNPFGLGNVTDDIPAGNPANGINITSSGANGALKFTITGAGDNPTTTISPQTGVSPAGPLTGNTFFALFRKPGIYVITVDDGKGNVARKMIPITQNEANGGQRFNDAFAVDVTFITGRFSLDSDKPDSVAFRGRFPLQSARYPEGSHKISVGIGNIITTSTVDARGRGKSLSTVDFRNNSLDAKQRLRFKYDRKQQRAALDLMLRFPNLDSAGFDSEGVLSGFATGGNQLQSLNIPVVVLIDDNVSFASRIPAGFTVRNGTAQVVGSKK